MNLTKSQEQINELYEFARAHGFSDKMLLTGETLDRFVETAIDGYEGYPLFNYIFNGPFNAELLTQQITIDLKAKNGTVAGLTSSEEYESVMIVSPPMIPEAGFLQYARVIHPKDYPILFKAATKRQGIYEKYAYKKRKDFLDDKTWYIYIYATKDRFKRQGYGKKIMKLIKDFASTNGYKLILETDLDENVPMYEKFGFSQVDSDRFMDSVNHFVMLS